MGSAIHSTMEGARTSSLRRATVVSVVQQVNEEVGSLTGFVLATTMSVLSLTQPGYLAERTSHGVVEPLDCLPVPPN